MSTNNIIIKLHAFELHEFFATFILICSNFISGFSAGNNNDVYYIFNFRSYYHVVNFMLDVDLLLGCWSPVFDILMYTILLTIAYCAIILYIICVYKA